MKEKQSYYLHLAMQVKIGSHFNIMSSLDAYKGIPEDSYVQYQSFGWNQYPSIWIDILEDIV
jgi:hypothetical protein